MAKLHNGYNGPFSGKFGTGVGATWKGICYIRARPIRTAKPTKNEKANRAKFKIAQHWLSPLLDFVRVGWKGYTPTVEGFIAAKSYLMKNAMEGTGEESKVIPSKMLVSYGDLPLSENISVQLINGNQLQFTWDTAIPAGTHKRDQVMLMAYNEKRESNYIQINGQFRFAGSETLQISSNKGQTYHVYAAFIAADRSRQSMSVYLGEIAVW